MIVVLINFEQKSDATRIGRALLEKRLIACYNMWPVESAFWWKGRITDESGYVMMAKTTFRWYDDIAEFVKQESGYELPEVIALDTEKIEPYYQQWLNDSIK